MHEMPLHKAHPKIVRYGGPGVGVTKPIFSVPLFSRFFPNDENSGCLNDIKFIFGRCHRSWAAETPGKHEHDCKYLSYTFAKSKFPLTEKLTNGALVTLTPGRTADKSERANSSTEAIGANGDQGDVSI